MKRPRGQWLETPAMAEGVGITKVADGTNEVLRTPYANRKRNLAATQFLMAGSFTSSIVDGKPLSRVECSPEVSTRTDSNS
jgi:hypothetical protein